MAINGKNKGNTYERKIVKKFKNVIQNHKYSNKVRFERTAASGGLSEQGDIQCVSGKWIGKRFVRDGYVDFPFGIECKHTKDITLHKIIGEVTNKKVTKILDQVIDESVKLSKPVALIMKIKNVDDLIAFRIVDSLSFSKELSDYVIKFRYKNSDWLTLFLDDFLKNKGIKDIIHKSISKHFNR